MKSLARTCASLLLFGSLARADVSPMDTPLPPGEITRITCAYGGQPVVTPGGKILMKAGEYHYDVYVPDDYDKDPKAKFPCLFIADPGGNAKLGRLEDRVKQSGMIAVMLVESKNGDTDPIVANFLSAHDDALKRLRIAHGFKYMTGFSGGARATCIDTSLRPGFSGIILQGAGLSSVANAFGKTPAMAVFAIFGAQDDNRREVAQLSAGLPPAFLFRYRLWDGGHAWAPQAVVEEGMDYLEQWTYFGAPTVADGKGVYLRYFDGLLKKAAATSDFEKYDLLDTAGRLAQIRRLTKDKALAEKITAAKKQAAELASLPDVKKEIAARAAFYKVQNTEDPARRQAAAKVPAVVASAKKAYESVAEKNPGTVYGQKAAAEAERLAGETDVNVSTK